MLGQIIPKREHLLEMKDHVVLRELLCRAVVSLSLIHQASIHVVLFYPAQGVAAGNSFRWIAIIGCQGGNAHIHSIIGDW